MRSYLTVTRAILCAMGICFFEWTPAVAAQNAYYYAVAQRILQEVCDRDTPAEVATEAGVDLVSFDDVSVRGRVMGWQARFEIDKGNDFRVQRLAPGDRFRGARLEWWAAESPQLSVSVDNGCGVRTARRMIFDETGIPDVIVHLDPQLNDTSRKDLLNPPVPAGIFAEGVSVAMVDAGVNYTLPGIAERLARGRSGEILGYDYWDLDRRPFDSNPARSPFFPQRHGTRTASLLLREAPDALLVPYRYPRPDMTRMEQLLEEATRDNVKVVGIPLGGARRAEWKIFSDHARNMKSTLFVVSAGNSGVNIDFNPVYPASLDLDNMIVVTSADDSGEPAEGSNWGRISVDLLVPAERQRVIDFHGSETIVSGSSYAVSRVVALASRLLTQNQDWNAAELKTAIFERAIREVFDEFVSIGYLPDPLATKQDVSLIDVSAVEFESAHGFVSLELSLHIGLLENSGWAEPDLPGLMTELDKILRQCGIQLSEVQRYKLRVPSRLLDFDVAGSHTLVTQAGLPTPSVYLVRDTLRQPAFEGEAFGQANTRNREWLRDTVWLTAGVSQPDVALAHELFHVLSNSGAHEVTTGNLMLERTNPGDTRLSEKQCRLARTNGVAAGLIKQP